MEKGRVEMSMYLTSFEFYKNTPLTDFQNTILFKNNKERDNFFLKENHYQKIELKQGFNFVRDRLTLKTPIPYEKCDGINYCTFLSERDNIRYYAFIIDVTYINEGVTQFTLLIDGIMTFCQGNVLNTIGEVEVLREHLSKSEYINYDLKIRTNSDVLKTTTKSYVYNKADIFSSFWVLFECSVNLSKDFGSDDNPKLPSSKGLIYDRLTSPVDLYIVPFKEFNRFMELLSDFPWISQNIKKVIMLPDEFVDKDDFVFVEMKEPNNEFKELRTFKNGNVTSRQTFGTKLSLEKISKIVGIDLNEEKHLLRNEYLTIECFSWDGQAIYLDPAFLPDYGLEYDCLSSIGYFNQIAIYPKDYQSKWNEKDSEGVNKGTFLNNAIIYNTFNELPILIDNYKLSLANNAHRRELAESKLLSNRFENITNPNNGKSLESKFMDAANLTTNVTSFTQLGEKFTNEYEFYRTQKAEQADMAIQAPTINGQANGTAFQISTNTYGITTKISALDWSELTKIKKYYNTFGFDIQERKVLSNVFSMSKMNYVQFKGSWIIPNVDTKLLATTRVQFENGVKLWHNNGTSNPINKNLLENKRVL